MKKKRKKKINRHFDANSRKRGGGMASPWKISLFSAWWKKFLVSSRSIHRWNADKRADEPVRALIVKSGNSSRREKRTLQTFIFTNKCLRPVVNTLSTKFYQFFERNYVPIIDQYFIQLWKALYTFKIYTINIRHGSREDEKS